MISELKEISLVLRSRFATRYGYAPVGIWAAPGRVNLIGEHTDYNEGFVLPLAIQRSTLVAVGLRSDGVVNVASGADGEVVSVRLDELDAGSVQGWAAYPLGVVWALREAAGGLGQIHGLDVLFESNVPVGAGLSSSAAIECSIAVALNELAGSPLTTGQLALAGQRAENLMVGAPTGIMDQTASLLGLEGHAVFLDCRSHETEQIPLDLHAAGLRLVVMDTRVSHAHADGGYSSRRASCEKGAAALGVPSLRDVSTADLAAASRLLDEETLRRVRHVVTENERVLETVGLLRKDGPESIGAVLTSSHSSMRDDFQISCPELDLAVDTALRTGALGARMTGGGFGGAAIALVADDDVHGLRSSVTEAFQASGYRKPKLFEVHAGDGAGRLP